MLETKRKRGRPMMEGGDVKSCRRIIALTRSMDLDLIERAKREKDNGSDTNVSEIIRLSIKQYLQGDKNDNA